MVVGAIVVVVVSTVVVVDSVVVVTGSGVPPILQLPIKSSRMIMGINGSFFFISVQRHVFVRRC